MTIWVKLVDFTLSLMKPGPERQILDNNLLSHLYVDSKKKKIELKTENGMVAARGSGLGAWRDTGQKTFTYTTDKFWESNVHYGGFC